MKSYLKKLHIGQFAYLRGGLGKKEEGGGLREGVDTPIHTMMTKVFLSVFPKMLSEIFFSKSC